MALFNINPQSELNSMVSSSVSQARSSVVRNRTIRNTILYLLGTVLIFGLVGYLGHLIVRNLPGDAPGFWGYLTVMIVVLLLGFLNISIMRSAMPSVSPDNYLVGTLITLLIGIVGGISIFVLSFGPKVLGIPDVTELKANVRPLITTMLIFPLPFFISWAHAAYDRIPPKIYKFWQYNPLLQMPNLTDAEFRRTTNVIFVVDIRHGEQNIYDIRSFIPDKMSVGDGFQFSLDEHNEDEPHRKIEVRDPKNPNSQTNLYKWHFYVQKPWYRPNIYIDPTRDCRENFLQNGDRITTRRIG
ncbi:hypothetical protein DYU11_09055 [Fibrisoma montanum]|uniref:Uncharacterized protein n=1 Tax=Fibrisoma montanum TaxID=2305895 RepID=A0A418MF85_9BACT|nr:TssN family type VI secretion system protein [Fibrisoma montanum]RIV25436.1 hypothetical protein DYU11_09055 [Fibrisoma montanum]